MNRLYLDNEQLKGVRDGVDWRRLFEHLGIRKDEKRSSPDDWWGTSPFSPEEKNASFHMNDNGWYCHSTTQGGGPIELVQAFEDCNCFDAARWLLDRGLSTLRKRSRRKIKQRCAVSSGEDSEELKADRDGAANRGLRENQPIRQDLRPMLNSRHPEFEKRGISTAVLEELGVGYYAAKEGSRSPMAGRLVFQIRG